MKPIQNWVEFDLILQKNELKLSKICLVVLEQNISSILIDWVKPVSIFRFFWKFEEKFNHFPTNNLEENDAGLKNPWKPW